MDLLVDLGNSRMKWAWSGAGAWRVAAADLDADLAGLCERSWAPAAPPARVILCSVLDEPRTASLVDWIRQRWGLAPHRVRAQAAQLGVTNSYRDPASLGSDRWAALLGARQACAGAVSVVDCGSAVTVDALSAHGEFLGGAIFPGLRLLHQSLLSGTAGVRASGGDSDRCLARATADAVAAGALFGLCGAIERIVEEQRRALGGGAQVLLTGGDAPAVAARLRLDAILDPDLVLKGLARIAGTLA